VKLITLERYRDLVWVPGCAPTLSTLRRQIRGGRLPGGSKLFSRYYVDIDANERLTTLATENADRLAELRADPRLKGLI
jgi:hypothetical protein